MDKHHLYFGSNLKLSKGITESARFAADICALLRPEDLSSVTAFIIPSYLAIPGVRDAIGPEGRSLLPGVRAGEASSHPQRPDPGAGPRGGGQIPLLYGGSVNPDNADALIHQPDIDGLFVGQAQRGPELIFRPPRRPTKPIKRRRSVCSISA